MPGSINDPNLGTLTWNADLDTWESIVELRPGCRIKLALTTVMDVSRVKSTDKLQKRGAAMLDWARRMESDCRERIADELLDVYNESWRPTSATNRVTRAAFIKRITPKSLVLDIDGSGFFYWTANDLFEGHIIELRFRKDFKISTIALAG